VNEQECPHCPKSPKPPIGIMPERIWVQRRTLDLLGAMSRYVEAGLPVDPEWIFELERHVLPKGVLETK